MARSLSIYPSLKEAVDKVRIVDTHEHFLQESVRLADPGDFLTALAYACYAGADLVSVGLSTEDLDRLADRRLSVRERWNILSPFWEKMRNTGYARALEVAVRDLYEIDGLSAETVQDLDARMKERSKEGFYEWVLKDMSGIQVSITDSRTVEVDRRFFAPVMRFEEFILVSGRDDIEYLSKRCNFSIHSLDELVKAIESEFQRISDRIVGVKIGLAYRRPIIFEKTTWDEAERAFNHIYRTGRFKRVIAPGRLGYSFSHSSTPERLSPDEARPLEDFVVHRLIQLAGRHNLPVQVHTGLQHGNENLISNSDPTLLTNLFMEYKDVKFDVFHGSYPYMQKLGVLAKTFPNVYADMCWMHIISPAEARRTLSEWLDSVPASKILGFGGDCDFVEEAYGHAVIARENIARVLSEKVEEGSFTLEQAKLAATMLLRENARSVFSL